MTLKMLIGGALLAAGCASPQKIEYGAMRHEQQAREAASQGNYARAASEQEAAQKQYRKAATRQWQYPYYY
jgi:uncharacterized lipoprotein YmbA